MGLESYLFCVEFKDHIQEKDLDSLLTSIGLTQVRTGGGKLTDFREYYYEMLTEHGITEAHSLFPPNDETVTDFSLRFSISSPTSVIDQTFNLLNRLNTIKPIKIRDIEIYNQEYRSLRQQGKVDNLFRGLSESEDKLVRDKSYIPIDITEFKENKLEIRKRAFLLKDNSHQAVIRGGAATIDHIKKKGMLHKFWEWIKSEL